jgi:hypothetical protein
MKTAMQELIEQLKEERDGFLKLPPHSNIQERTKNCFGSCIEIAERMLEKEKEQMDNVAGDWWNEGASYMHDGRRKYESFEQYYNETFNTKEE